MDFNSLSDDDLIALSNKNYDALSDDGLLFLANSKSQPKRNTTVLEDIGIGIHNAAAPVVKFGGMVAGAVPSYLGDTDTADSIYKKMDEQLASMKDYWVPKDAEQNFAGKAIGTVGTIPAQLLSFPFSPADTGKELVDSGESIEKATGGAMVDTFGNTLGVALPGAIGGNLLKKFASGAAINAAQETATKGAIQEIAQTKEAKEKFAPTIEGAALAAIVGGPMGALSPSKPTVDTPKPKPTVDKTDPSIKTDGHVPSEGEIQMLQMVHRNAADSLKVIQDKIDEVHSVIEQGDTSPAVVEALTALANEHKALEKTMANIEEIFADPSRIPESLFVDAQIKQDALMNKARERRKAGYTPRKESPPPTLEDTARRGGDEPKTTPMEIALVKIEQAKSMQPEALVQRRQDTQEALQSLENKSEGVDVPGDKYNAQKAAMEQEIEAYNNLLEGKQPDLSWFKGEEPPVESERIRQDGPPDIWNELDEQLRKETTESSNKVPVNVYEQDANLVRDLPDSRGTTSGVTRSPKQAYQHHSYELNKLERILENVNKQIQNFEEGKTPSGTFDDATAYKNRENLESQIAFHRDAVENVLKNSPELRDNLNKPVGEKVEVVPTPVEKFASVEDAITHSSDNLVEAFHNNTDLFNNKSGSDVFFDKNLPKELVRVLQYFVDKLGLSKEKVFFVDTNQLPSYGRVRHYGNSTVIFINREAVAKRMENKTFGTIRVAAHEMGHFLFNKYLQTHITHTSQLEKLEQQFQSYLDKNKLNANFSGDSINIIQRQSAFHEFFAERMARELMYNHALGAFTAKSKYLQAFSKMLDKSWKFIEKSAGGFSKKNFVDDIIQNVLGENKKSIEETGKTLFEKVETERNDKLILANRDPEAYPFFGKTLEETRNIVSERGWTYSKETAGDAMAINNDIVPISMRAARALGSGANYLTTKFFGKTGVAQIFRDNPVIQDVYWKIRDAEQKAATIANNLWYGDVNKGAWEKAGFFAKLSKIKEGLSAYMIVKTSKPEDMAAVHDVLKKGFEDVLEYHEALDKYGSHLNKEQQQIFKTLTEMWTKQYEATVREQERMGKKNILPRRKGWYPAVRRGDYYVDISYQGQPAYREHFTTEAEGRAFIEKLGEGNLKYLTATGVEKVKVDMNESFLDTIDTFKDFLTQKYSGAGSTLKQDIENYVKSIVTRGGKLGKHHQHRMNLQGYKGSEVFATPSERGNSFKTAIQSSVGDYTGTLRKMMINHSVDPILRTGTLAEDSPNTYRVVEQMTDSALNRVENKMQTLDDGIRNGVDTIAKGVYDVLGKEFKPGDPVFDKIKNNVLETFYLMKLMAKPVFAVGQVLSTPVQAIRHMAYDGGFRAYLSFGKGLAKLATGDAELKDSMFRVSQTTNTFEPQFIEALHLNKNDNSIVEGIKKYVFLNKVNEGADSLSRALTYAAMYEHYKSLGKSKAEAEKLAMHGTDSTMVQYGRSEQAPIFQHSGIAGEMVRPLQTFGQAQLANIISDIRHFETMKPSTWAPLLTYGLTATAVGGVLSAQFIQEYEIIRKWLATKFPEYAPPPILDLIAHDETMMDRILPDNEAARHAVMFGLPSISGIDLASSVRANETFATMVGAVILSEEAWVRMFPLLNFTADAMRGAGTLTAKALGNPTTAGQTAKAIQQVAPVGPIAYGAKELAGVNETRIGGKNTGMMAMGATGDASLPRTKTDIVAGLMGTRSTNDRLTTLATIQRAETDKKRNLQVKNLADLAIETGDPKYLEKIVALNVTPTALKNMIGTEMYNRLVESDTRYIVNAKGKAPATAETARKAQVLDKFRRTE